MSTVLVDIGFYWKTACC